MEDEQRERTARRFRRIKRQRIAQDAFDRRYDVDDNSEPGSGKRSRRRSDSSAMDELDSDYESQFSEG
jgi:hypothetical protein